MSTYMMVAIIVIGAAVALADEMHSGEAPPAPECSSSISGNEQNQRYFAYMDARNHDGSKKRTHVYALTTAGTLVTRYTSKIEEWRRSLSDGDCSSTSSTSTCDDELLRYNKTLAFPSPTERNKRVVSLYDAIHEFNTLAQKFFDRGGKAVPPDHLLVMREKFGRDYEGNNLYHPSGEELNSLHEQFSLLLGPGIVDPVSTIWGNWTEHLHYELVTWLGQTPESFSSVDVFNGYKDVEYSKLCQSNDNAIVLRMYDLLRHVNTRIHATENMNSWTVDNRFTFNTFKLGDIISHEPLLGEDFEPDRWRMSMEMGALYLAYAAKGKHLLSVMIDNDMNALKNNAEVQTIQFQDSFNPELYTVWMLSKEAETRKRRHFKEFWDERNVSDYGFEWGNRTEPNGFIRLGQQICDPPSDCDRKWADLIDDFAETPHVEDIRFLQMRPYGETDEDLRFLNPEDPFVL